MDIAPRAKDPSWPGLWSCFWAAQARRSGDAEWVGLCAGGLVLGWVGLVGGDCIAGLDVVGLGGRVREAWRDGVVGAEGFVMFEGGCGWGGGRCC